MVARAETTCTVTYFFISDHSLDRTVAARACCAVGRTTSGTGAVVYCPTPRRQA